MAGRMLYTEEELLEKLYRALLDGEEETAVALARRVGVEAADRNGHTVLHRAVRAGLPRVLETVLARGASPDRADRAGVTPLHLACRLGDTKAMEVLLDDSDVDAKTHRGQTPLKVLLASGRPAETVHEGVQMLLQVGANASSTGRGEQQHKTALMVALENRVLDKTLALILTVDRNFATTDPEGNGPLHYCARHGNAYTLVHILEQDPEGIFATNKAGLKPLDVAMQHAQEALAVRLLGIGKEMGLNLEEMSTPSAERLTLLHVAASNGMAEMIKALADEDEDLDAKDLSGRTALMHACLAGHVGIVQILLGFGASPSVKDAAGMSAVHFACFAGKAETLDHLVQYGASCSVVDFGGSSPLHVAAIQGSAAFILKVFSAEPMQIVAMNTHGMTPLHVACVHSNYECILALTEADNRMYINTATRGGRTPLWIATASGRPECVATLIDRGADPDIPDADGKTPLSLAAELGDTEITALLCDALADKTRADNRGISPLVKAVRGEHVGPVKILLDAGTSVDKADDSGATALHYAAATGSPQCCLLLAQEGADTNRPDGRKRTPLHIASYKGQMLAGLSLLHMGADITLLDANKRTPPMAAVSGGHRSMAKILEDEARRLQLT